MRPPQETGSRIETGIFKQRFPHIPKRIADQQRVIHEERPELSEAFRNLLPFIPFDHTMRVTLPGDVLVTFLREDLKVPEQDRKPHTLYLVERVNPFEDIDAAARGLGYVSESYNAREGEVTRNTLNVIEEAQQISYELQRTGITDQELLNMSQVAQLVFVQSKFASSESYDKVRIIAQTIKALSRDARNRINTPRSRLIMAQIREPLTRMIFKGREIRNKNLRRRTEILQEREMEQMYMKFVEQHVEDIFALSVGDGAFDNGLRRFLELAHSYLSPRSILVKPYSPVAAEARFLLFADDRERLGPDGRIAVERLSSYVGEGRASEIAVEKPFFELDSFEKKARLLSIASMLQVARQSSDISLNTSKDEELVFEEGTMFNPEETTA